MEKREKNRPCAPASRCRFFLEMAVKVLKMDKTDKNGGGCCVCHGIAVEFMWSSSCGIQSLLCRLAPRREVSLLSTC